MGTGEITAAEFDMACETPGNRIRSQGRGRGLARGRGYGPIGAASPRTGEITATEGQSFGVFTWWNPTTWAETKEQPNFKWTEVEDYGWTSGQIDQYLRSVGLTRWAAERNINLDGMLERLVQYYESGVTTPTGQVVTRVSEKTPEQVAASTFTEGVARDVKQLPEKVGEGVDAALTSVGLPSLGKMKKYVGYGVLGLGAFYAYKFLKGLRIL